ncbi:MAG: competence/damage-inducible protein A [Bacteroidales bacterium]|nr:competence/damage-inducible protein A [Bacteroidales bacterium]
MKAEIISIGDELLIGQTINTNAAWMGQELNKIGVDVHQVSAISDDKEHIIQSLDEARQRVDLVLITGGLGPTKDDITKTTLADYFKTSLVINPDILESIKGRLKSRNLEINELNRQQALVPEDSRIILNEWGTAPGMWFEDEGKVFVAMPGVPVEMKGLMSKYILPAVKEKFHPPVILHKTLLTLGTIEARLADILEEFENELPKELKLAYLPTSPIIKLRFSARGADSETLEAILDAQVEKLRNIIPDLVFGVEPDTLEEIVGDLLKERKQTISTAESCTGGNISRLLTSVSGSSDYYVGSVVAYAYEAKTKTLGVNLQDLEKHGAVSGEIVTQMAEGVKKLMQTDYAIAVSGIAGPGGGLPRKPVGTIWIAISSPKGTVAQKFNLGKDRYRNIHSASIISLNLLRKSILNI